MFLEMESTLWTSTSASTPTHRVLANLGRTLQVVNINKVSPRDQFLPEKKALVKSYLYDKWTSTNQELPTKGTWNSWRRVSYSSLVKSSGRRSTNSCPSNLDEWIWIIMRKRQDTKILKGPPKTRSFCHNLCLLTLFVLVHSSEVWPLPSLKGAIDVEVTYCNFRTSKL